MLSRMESLGETTVSIEDLADLWTQSGNTLDRAEDVIFGDTPLTATFQRLVRRFETERQHDSLETRKVLFVLWDGEPTDGDPRRPIAKTLPSDVAIVSCFVTNDGVTVARSLFAVPDSTYRSSLSKNPPSFNPSRMSSPRASPVSNIRFLVFVPNSATTTMEERFSTL
jgi:hypothetical protein